MQGGIDADNTQAYQRVANTADGPAPDGPKGGGVKSATRGSMLASPPKKQYVAVAKSTKPSRIQDIVRQRAPNPLPVEESNTA